MKRKGFGLVQVILAVCVVSLTLFIAIPGINCAKINSNEHAVTANLYSLGTIFDLFRFTQRRYPNSITELADYTTNEKIIQATSNSTPYKGYYFEYTPLASGYQYVAYPAVLGITGNRSFEMTPSNPGVQIAEIPYPDSGDEGDGGDGGSDGSGGKPLPGLE